MSLRTRFVGAARMLATALPDRLIARIIPKGMRWNPDAMRVSAPPTTPVRLLIAPTNSAGQAYQWARAAEAHLPLVGAVNFMTTNARSDLFAFPSDLSVPETGYLFAHGWQRAQRSAIITGFSHVLLESGRYLYGPVPWRSPHDVLDDLTRRGLKVGLLWHGSDIRVPSSHAEWEEDSPFGARGRYPAASMAILERNARERLRMIDSSDMVSFVSTPGLLSVPRSRWLPVVVDPERWRSERIPLTSSQPVVAYVPSNSPMKGDASIDEQLGDLASAGLITYRRLESISSNEMPAVYQSSDIVLDQFRLGDYGVAACEAMAAGCIVIGHVHQDVRDRVREMTGRELPILEARYADVGSAIKTAIQEPERMRAHADEGVAFVRAVHDGRLSASQLIDFLGVASDPIIARKVT